jgi:hypothetical protein
MMDSLFVLIFKVVTTKLAIFEGIGFPNAP